jgi:hypothetical protein
MIVDVLLKQTYNIFKIHNLYIEKYSLYITYNFSMKL